MEDIIKNPLGSSSRERQINKLDPGRDDLPLPVPPAHHLTRISTSTPPCTSSTLLLSTGFGLVILLLSTGFGLVRAPSHILPKYPTRGSKLSQRATTEAVAKAKKGFSQANDPRPRATSQRSPTGQKDRQNECKNAQRSIGGRGALNFQTGQNRLSRHRVARTFVHTTHGNIRLVQILVIQAFQIFKLIGHRRSDASSIKFQALSGFSLNRMGPTAQPSQAIKPRLKPPQPSAPN
ncbi:hypothetical protein CRG98_022899 [Punica granatum]|uniref:Uncharacterized protein n=1 Tax=Punica granatum TaxID=22663 RepID=A0A2I0JKE4_PUNGR|nr:hypothetical protein CRG98_022899 [Punica granatum]